MYIKKLIFTFLIIIFFLQTTCFADDILNESDLDSFIQTSTTPSNSQQEPITNSRHIIAIDRKTMSVLYEKDAYSETPMASTTKMIDT